MDFAKKRELCSLLNTGKYQSSLDYIKSNLSDVDDVDIDMFISSFPLKRFEMIEEIKDELIKWKERNVSLVIKMRISLFLMELDRMKGA